MINQALQVPAALTGVQQVSQAPLLVAGCVDQLQDCFRGDIGKETQDK